jgi:hypothetical protein
LAVVARRPASDLSRVIVARGRVEIPDRPVFETTGRLASPMWSPDGDHVPVRWNEADEWLLVPAAPVVPAARGIVAISPVGQRFGGVPTVRGWCCG